MLPDALDEFEAALARGDLKELKALATSSGTPDAAARSANLERVASTENIAICLGCALRRSVGDRVPNRGAARGLGDDVQETAASTRLSGIKMSVR